MNKKHYIIYCTRNDKDSYLVLYASHIIYEIKDGMVVKKYFKRNPNWTPSANKKGGTWEVQDIGAVPLKEFTLKESDTGYGSDLYNRKICSIGALGILLI